MSYINSSLGRNETLRYVAHFPWFYRAAAFGSLIVMLALAALALSYDGRWMAGLFVLLGLVAFLAIIIPIWTTEIGVTSQRLIHKRGWIRRKTDDLQLRSVEEVNLEQGLLGRLLNFGHLEVHGTGIDDIILPTIGDPLALSRALQEAMGAAPRVQPAVVAAPSPAHSA